MKLPQAVLAFLPPSLIRRGLPAVQQATTEAERRAIFRFRYRVYVEELNIKYGGIDHAAQEVRDSDDDHAIHLYVGAIDNIEGVMRVRIWPQGSVPEDAHDHYSLDRLGAALDGLVLADVCRLMIRQDRRASGVLPALCYELLDRVAAQGVDLLFLSCRPALVRHYAQLGARAFGGRMIETPDGIGLPMVIVISDVEHMRRAGSPLTPVVASYYGRGRRPVLDMHRLAPLLREVLHVPLAPPEEVWATVEGELLDQRQRDAQLFLDRLSPRARERLLAEGTVVDVAKNSLLTREGQPERELYLILQCTFEASLGGTRLRLLGRGDIFGEMAFFRDAGRRSASVRALRDGQVVVLRRRLIDEPMAAEPKIAAEILLHLGRVLAERLAQPTPTP